MSIDTEITGSPSSIRASAEWIGSTLRRAVGEGVDAFAGARTQARGDWRGETGTAFEGAMGRAVHTSQDLCLAASTVQGTFLDYAGELEICQDRMEGIRTDARAAGLTITGYFIQPPGPGPAAPGHPPDVASQTQVEAYNAAVTAYNAHQALVEAYNDLVTRAQGVWSDIERAWERVSAQNRAMDGPGWAFQLSDIAGGLGGALTSLHASVLRDHAKYFGPYPRILDTGCDYAAVGSVAV